MKSDCPAEAFSWLTARAAESLIVSEGIDLVEAPEWEAPLYYLQLRRRLGLGVNRHPPCVVHLHSPSTLIFQHNDWNPDFSDYQRLRQLEAFSVAAADALVCPSAYLARQVAGLFGGEPVEVIPYPAPATPQRNARRMYGGATPSATLDGWNCGRAFSNGSKRRFRWPIRIRAWNFTLSAVTRRWMADPDVRSAVTYSIRSLDRYAPGFTSRGACRATNLPPIWLNSPRLSVPSRWDNLPYTCIEAMCSGIPVLVTATGGMAELITEGESGWVSPRPTPTDLAEALQRFLLTPPEARERWGGRPPRSCVGSVRGKKLCVTKSIGAGAWLRPHLPGLPTSGPRRPMPA